MARWFDLKPRVILRTAILWLAAMPAMALAWGRMGHETVGYIAISIIGNTRAESEVRRILQNDESLATAAEWPDCAKGSTYCHALLDAEMLAYRASNPSHHAYHYTDVPFQRKTYQPGTAGTGPHDIVHILQDAIRVLRGEAPENTGHVLDERTALFILVHMVGDLHQPLHVGSAYVNGSAAFFNPTTRAQVNSGDTQGGNWLCVGTKGLHGLWDSDYVAKAMRLAQMKGPNGAFPIDAESFARTLLALPIPVEAGDGDPVDWPSQWADESLALARRQFTSIKVASVRRQDDRGGCGKADTGKAAKAWTITLPAGYAAKASGEVPSQLVKAGTRLGNLLMAIWPSGQR